jgi:hypothetical protein
MNQARTRGVEPRNSASQSGALSNERVNKKLNKNESNANYPYIYDE